jgi:teichuronic acid biosynthesis glycosyltransferase TuaH
MSRSNVAITFSVEMLEDATSREFCRPPDQRLLALASNDKIGSLFVAWRSLPVSLLRRRPVQLREEIQSLADRRAQYGSIGSVWASPQASARWNGRIRMCDRL